MSIGYTSYSSDFIRDGVGMVVLKHFIVKRTTHLAGYAKDHADAIEKAKKGEMGEVRSWFNARRRYVK